MQPPTEIPMFPACQTNRIRLAADNATRSVEVCNRELNCSASLLLTILLVIQMANVWKIAPGEHAEDWEVFRENGCVGLGWELPDYRKFGGEDEVLSALEQKFGKNKKGYGKGAATMIWRFVDVIKRSDIVVASEGYNRVVGIGVVHSDYLAPKSRQNPIRDDTSTHRYHVRLVNWLITKPVELPGDRFFVQPTLWPLKAGKVDQIKQQYLRTYPDDSEVKERLERLFSDIRPRRLPPTAPRPMSVAPVAGKADKLRDWLEENERLAGGLPPANLATKAAEANPDARKVTSVTVVYVRDSYVAAEAKRLANGNCDLCGEGSPFYSEDGRPYLESHHVIWLAHDGRDALDNVVALCPNCHRKMHVRNEDTDVAKLHRKIVSRSAETPPDK